MDLRCRNSTTDLSSPISKKDATERATFGIMINLRYIFLITKQKIKIQNIVEQQIRNLKMVHVMYPTHTDVAVRLPQR